MAGEHSNRGRKRAREVRAALGLGPVEPVGCILTLVEEQARVAVIAAELPVGVAGFCLPHDTLPIVGVNAKQYVGRCRFTLAHELGHIRLGHATRADSTRMIFDGDHDPAEVEANAFAAEFLAPEQGVGVIALRRRRDAGLDEVVRIWCTYGISPLAAIYSLRGAVGIPVDRVERLRRELAANEHHALREHLGLEPFHDRLDDLALPYLSPALSGSALAAQLGVGAAPGAAAATATATGLDGGTVTAAVGHLDPAVRRRGRP